MNLKMKRIMVVLIGLLGLVLLAGCATTQSTPMEKSGAQLWGENCVRCHNAPSPAAFSDVEWETIGMHMRVRANLTKEDMLKIIEFMKLANG